MSDSCKACDCLRSEVDFLRKMVTDLNEKMMCLSADSGDRYHRLRMAEVTAHRQQETPMVAMDPAAENTEVEFLDSMMKGMVDQVQREMIV